jgi:hypothetical protein
MCRQADWLVRQEKVDFDFARLIRTTTFDCLERIRECCTIRTKNGAGLVDGKVQEGCTTNMKSDDCGVRLEVVDCRRNIFVGTAVGVVERYKNRRYAVEELVEGEGADCSGSDQLVGEDIDLAQLGLEAPFDLS